MCQPRMIDLSSNLPWVGYFNGLKLLITIADVTLIDGVLIAGKVIYIFTNATPGLSIYSRTPVERPPSPTTIPLIRPYFV